MLESHAGLGVYILVLANAAYDAKLWAQLSPALSARHAELAAALTDTLRRGQKLAEPDDDVLVFLRLNAIAFEHLGIMEGRRAGPWEVMFNPIRALHPPRISGMKLEGLLRPFEPAAFHFNKAFLAKEILWEGDLAGKPARLLYNKFPFTRQHGLLVPEPLRQAPQCLTPELNGWAWDLCAQSGGPASAWATIVMALAPRSTTCISRASCRRAPADAGSPLCPQRRHPALPTALPALHRSRRSLVSTRPTAPAPHPPTTSSTALDACASLPASRRTAAS